MTRQHRIWTGLVIMLGAFGLFACAGNKVDTVKDWSSLKITLERSPCFGACPSYKVEITGDGTVVYTGQRFVAVEGIHKDQISEAAVKALTESFRQANVFSLQNAYRAQVTDLPIYRISIAYDGKEKTIDDYGGRMINMPQSITDLENAIDKTANTAQWIGKPAAP